MLPSNIYVAIYLFSSLALPAADGAAVSASVPRVRVAGAYARTAGDHRAMFSGLVGDDGPPGFMSTANFLALRVSYGAALPASVGTAL